MAPTHWSTGLLLGMLLLAPIFPTQAEHTTKTRATTSDWGGIGLQQTRTARHALDGTFVFGGSLVEPYTRIFLNWQIFPWLETTFRYTDDPALDRGGDVKLRLLEESSFFPEVSVGLQDMIGTGQFDSEYIVASKRYYDFDFSVGMVWGYGNGSDGLFRNPLTYFSDRFRFRNSDVGLGGNLGLGNFFSGETVSLFGGVEYFTLIDGFSLKLEYDPNDFRAEPGTNQARDFPVNGAIVYRPLDLAELSLGLERGNRIMARVALRANFHEAGVENFNPKAPPSVLSREKRAQVLDKIAAASKQSQATPPVTTEPDPAAFSARLFTVMDGQGLSIRDLLLTKNELVVHLAKNGKSLDAAILSAVLRHIVEIAPPTVERFQLQFKDQNGTQRRLETTRLVVREEQMLNALFVKLDAMGLDVDGIELGARKIEVVVQKKGNLREAEYLTAARAVAEVPGLTDYTIILEGRQNAKRPLRLTFDPDNGRHDFARSDGTISTNTRKATLKRISPKELTILAEVAFKEGANHGLAIDAFEIEGQNAIVHVTPTRFPEAARNIGRAARIVANVAPNTVESITVATLQQGTEVSRVSVLRRDLEKAAEARGSSEELWVNAAIHRGGGGFSNHAIQNDRYPDFKWHLSPGWQQSVGDPDAPYTFQLSAQLAASVEFLPGIKLRGQIERDIINNFDELFRGPKGNLEPVRSNITNYLQNSELPIIRLQGDYIFSPSRNFYARLSAGYFERMFGGIGGEVLFRRQDARWAIGVDINHVRQREFKQQFGFRDYEVTTGHLGLYYQFPFWDLEGSVHIGRYLAGDRGATFQLARRFKSGILVGGFFTRTNVSAADFGEGSFDKGFFMSIPLDMILPRPSRQRGNIGFRPLTSDGGQMLEIGPKLYNVTSEGQFDSIARSWKRFLD